MQDNYTGYCGEGDEQLYERNNPAAPYQAVELCAQDSDQNHRAIDFHNVIVRTLWCAVRRNSQSSRRDGDEQNYYLGRANEKVNCRVEAASIIPCLRWAALLRHRYPVALRHSYPVALAIGKRLRRLSVRAP